MNTLAFLLAAGILVLVVIGLFSGGAGTQSAHCDGPDDQTESDEDFLARQRAADEDD